MFSALFRFKMMGSGFFGIDAHHLDRRAQDGLCIFHPYHARYCFRVIRSSRDCNSNFKA